MFNNTFLKTFCIQVCLFTHNTKDTASAAYINLCPKSTFERAQNIYWQTNAVLGDSEPFTIKILKIWRLCWSNSALLNPAMILFSTTVFCCRHNQFWQKKILIVFVLIFFKSVIVDLLALFYVRTEIKPHLPKFLKKFFCGVIKMKRKILPFIKDCQKLFFFGV